MAGADERRPDAFGGVASTHIVVRLKADASRHLQPAAEGVQADVIPQLGNAFRAVTTDWGATHARHFYTNGFGNALRAAELGLDRVLIVEVPGGTDTRAMAAAFARLADDVELATTDTIGGVAEFIPNDASFGLQYALRNTGQVIQGQTGVPDADVDATDAWALHTGDLGTVTVAIIDSGVNSHTEYGANAPPYPNGRIVEGRNTNNPLTPTLTTDGCPHGTHIAGIVAAAGNNGMGMSGMTWGAYIMPVRVLNGCFGNVSQLAAGIVWAADHGAHFGNISLQYYGLAPAEVTLLQNAIDYATTQGMLLVAAAGNTNAGPSNPYVAYPARLPGCMAVSATDNRDLFASAFSRYGPEVDVCAPGDDIYSTWTANGYAYLYGTSMATPHISGLAALVKSYAPGLTGSAIESILKQSTVDLGPSGWDEHFGHGRINALSALLAAAPPCDGGAPCDDMLFCTVNDECANEVCSGTPNLCDDSLPCTVDSCDETRDLCVHVPDDSLCPQDGLFCNGPEVCDVNGGCVPTGSPCSGPNSLCCEAEDACAVNCCSDNDCADDGFTCTEDGCFDGQCSGFPQDGDCDDGDRCTDDRCDPGEGEPGTGCVNFDNGRCGACCHHASGDCSDRAIAPECSNVSAQDEFFVRQACAEVLASGACAQHTGACCDADTFGACTETFADECTCPACVWHKLRTCDQIGCTHATIPALSQWGAVVLTLSLLIGAKLRFARRTA
jgi:subtilisin family serine protease